MTLSWPAASDDVGVTEYLVYQDGVIVARPGTATTQTITGLSPSATYVFVIQAVDGAGNRSLDGPSATVRLDASPPTWPAGSALSGTASGDTATLVWTAATDDVAITGYRLYRDGLVVAEVDGQTLRAAVGNLTANVPYVFQVQAFDAAGNPSTDGPSTTLRIDTIVPTWPAGSSLSFVRTGARSARLVWTAAADDVGVAGYRLYQDGLVIRALDASSLTTEVAGLDPAATSTFRIEAVDVAGNLSTDGPRWPCTSACPTRRLSTLRLWRRPLRS